MALNNDILLAILSHLALRDVLAMRQACKAFRDLTHERSLWIPRYAEMVRDRQLPTPMIDHSLSQASMELAVLQNDLVDSAWRRASPKMESLRFVALPISEHDRIRYIQRGFMVPGGRYFLIFVYDRVYIVSLQEPSGTPVSFINLRDVNMEGLDITTSNWKAERHDDGSLTLFVSIRPANRDANTTTYAFWSADLHVSTPTQTYHGQFTIRRSSRNTRTKNELFMFSTNDGGYITILDWKALLRGDSFRYHAIRTGNPSDLSSIKGLRDFCLLPNGYILGISNGSDSLRLFAFPEFQTVSHLNQPLPTEYAPPLWQYKHQSMHMSDHTCAPVKIWALPLCNTHTDLDESSALVGGLNPSCCYRVAMGPAGPKVFGHQMLSDAFCFFPGRTRALVTKLDGKEGLRIGCLSHATKKEWESLSPQPYRTFDISTAQVPLWGLKGKPSSTARGVYWDEETGRMCFLPRNTLLGPKAGVLVLDFV